MELWIRSQDKIFLRKVNTIGIVEGRDFWGIEDNFRVSFGEYETKERALEVLDEIQRIIYPKEYIEFISDIKNESKTEVIKNHYISYLSSYVYEMPEN